MKYIKKSKKEPQVLTEAKAGGGNYDSLRKTTIQEELLEEQGYLCAYCMGRISLELNEHYQPKIGIEHLKSQYLCKEEGTPEDILNYSNMLGVCNGKSGECLPNKLEECLHCDKTVGGKAEGKVKLRRLNPLDESCEKLLKYNFNGTIQSIDENEEVEYDLNINLNLNNEKLKENRKIAFDKAWEQFKKTYKNKENWTKKTFQAEINKLQQTDKNHKYTAYCQCLIYLFEKKKKGVI